MKRHQILNLLQMLQVIKRHQNFIAKYLWNCTNLNCFYAKSYENTPSWNSHQCLWKVRKPSDKILSKVIKRYDIMNHRKICMKITVLSKKLWKADEKRFNDHCEKHFINLLSEKKV